MAKERERKAQEEPRRQQAQIKLDLRKKITQKIERERDAQRRAKEAAGALARRNRPKIQREIEKKLALYAAAMALAVSHGRERASLADFRECNGVPHFVSSKK